MNARQVVLVFCNDEVVFVLSFLDALFEDICAVFSVALVSFLRYARFDCLLGRRITLRAGIAALTHSRFYLGAELASPSGIWLVLA